MADAQGQGRPVGTWVTTVVDVLILFSSYFDQYILHAMDFGAVER